MCRQLHRGRAAKPRRRPWQFSIMICLRFGTFKFHLCQDRHESSDEFRGCGRTKPRPRCYPVTAKAHTWYVTRPPTYTPNHQHAHPSPHQWCDSCYANGDGTAKNLKQHGHPPTYLLTHAPIITPTHHPPTYTPTRLNPSITNLPTYRSPTNPPAHPPTQ